MASVPTSPAVPLDPEQERALKRLLWLVAVGFFMQTLDATIVNTALPAMASSLGESPLRMQSVVVAYSLAMAMLIPASGWLADRFGTRRIYVGAILLFVVGSVLCAMASSLAMLVAARVVQGLGGALLLPVGRLVVLRIFPRERFLQAMSFVAIPGLVGPLIGPTLGGWLVEAASWHWIFLINLPVGLLGCLVAMKLMPDLRSPVPSRFDSIGFLLFGGSMVLISIALEGLGELHLSHLRVVLLLIGGLVLLTAYWLRALRIDKPLFPPSLFKARTFAVGILGNLFARLGSGALPFLTPLLLQVGLGYPPSTAGMTMIPLALFAMVAKPMAKPLLDFFGYRKLLVGNTLILGCLIAGFGLVDQDTPYVWLLLHLSLLGAVNSLQFTAMNTLTLIDLQDSNASSGNSLMSVVVQLSISLGVACAAALLGGFQTDLDTGQDTVLGAFHATYVSVGLMSMLAAAIFFQLGSEDGRTSPRRVDPEKDPDL